MAAARTMPPLSKCMGPMQDGEVRKYILTGACRGGPATAGPGCPSPRGEGWGWGELLPTVQPLRVWRGRDP